MRIVIAFALGTIVGAPLLAAATEGWMPAVLSWSRPGVPKGGLSKVKMKAELPSNGHVVFETDGLMDSYHLVSGTERACSVSVPRETPFHLTALSDRGVSYALERAGAGLATVQYSKASAPPDTPRGVDPNPYEVATTQDARAARERKIAPSPMAGMKSLRCTSDTVASAGVWRTRDGYLEDVGKDKQSNVSTWSIVVGDDEAVVSRVDSTPGATVQPEVWNVGRAALGGMEGGIGLILTPKNRAPDVSPEAITIDEKTSSFVYTTQHVYPFYNRANVFYGTCSGR